MQAMCQDVKGKSINKLKIKVQKIYRQSSGKCAYDMDLRLGNMGQVGPITRSRGTALSRNWRGEGGDSQWIAKGSVRRWRDAPARDDAFYRSGRSTGSAGSIRRFTGDLGK